MERDPDNRIFFDHGGLTAFDDGKNQLVDSPTTPAGNPLEFQQEVSPLNDVQFHLVILLTLS